MNLRGRSYTSSAALSLELSRQAALLWRPSTSSDPCGLWSREGRIDSCVFFSISRRRRSRIATDRRSTLCVAADVVENNLTLLSVVVEKEIQYVEVVVSGQLSIRGAKASAKKWRTITKTSSKQAAVPFSEEERIGTYLLQLKKRSGSACSRIEIVAFSRKTKSGRKEGRH